MPSEYDFIRVDPDHADIFARFKDYAVRQLGEDELTLLKGHLLIEEVLTQIIEVSVRHPEHVEPAHLTFHQKLQLARSFSLAEHDNHMWDLVAALNTLRNDFAHALESDKRHRKVEAVKNLYFEIFSPDLDISQERALDDKTILSYAIACSLGFLGSFRKEARFLDRTAGSVYRAFALMHERGKRRK